MFRACEADETPVVDGVGAGQRLLHQLFRLCLRCRTPGMCAYLWSCFTPYQAPDKLQCQLISNLAPGVFRGACYFFNKFAKYFTDLNIIWPWQLSFRYRYHFIFMRLESLAFFPRTLPYHCVVLSREFSTLPNEGTKEKFIFILYLLTQVLTFCSCCCGKDLFFFHFFLLMCL